ncbi:hypothetical protein EVJ50_13050 [Synechococcus sp. RSCCF101]|uniref:hypothetical protein n=1 Tax=Synechococcus sp. RSCCF101 TaxID=2511069 RepID=UPI0012450038|nr:hypothetical protein [Synechococcus sp. RSCCF101]QEY33015.1 hypothetical protein EVJ50_13050 [Synechococcus sp. RSCCF101]
MASIGSPSPHRHRLLHRRLAGLVVLGLLFPAAAPGLAEGSGTVTRESNGPKSLAVTRARSAVPRGSTVDRVTCQTVDVGWGNTRYRCTAHYTTGAPAPSAEAMDDAPAAEPAPDS